MRYLPLLLLLTSCGALQQLQQKRDLSDLRGEINKGLDQVQAEVGKTLDEIEQLHKQAFEAADQNKNGVIDEGYEQWMYLLLGGGGLAEVLRRKLKNQDARIEHEREKRKALELAEIERLKKLAGQA